jgi:hypothetical protein
LLTLGFGQMTNLLLDLSDAHVKNLAPGNTGVKETLGRRSVAGGGGRVSVFR